MVSRYIRLFAFTAAVALSIFSRAAESATTQTPDLDLQKMMQPIPASSAFHDPGYFVWCGTMLAGPDGRYHLYYSRWKISNGFQAWVTSSEIAHAVGDSPTGPFVFHDVVLPARGKQFWDGLVTHNPTVKRFGKKYYLYYMGNTGDGKLTTDLNWVHRNNQRIGVAVASNPDGPWTRSNQPLIDVSADPNAPDSLCVANPGITQGADGKFLLLYKAVGRKRPLPFGGPVVHLMAESDSPTGPFRKMLKPLFTLPGVDFPFEDPFFWYDGLRHSYFVILKDNHGITSGNGHSTLVLYQSADAFNWLPAKHFLVSDLELHWKGRPVQPVKALERPQIMFDAGGNPTVLIVAIRDEGMDSYNVRIPLRQE